MSGRAPRDKGNRAERAVVKILREVGLTVQRVPLSGSAGGRFTGDISINTPWGDEIRCEVKCRSKTFKSFTQLYEWLKPVDVLIIKQDRCEPLVIMPIGRWAAWHWE